jgi:hypothetical protein
MASSAVATFGDFVTKVARRPEEFVTRSETLAGSIRQQLKSFFDYGGVLC